jgi:hypothetical protein
MSRAISLHQNRITPQFVVLGGFSRNFRSRLGVQRSMQASKKHELIRAFQQPLNNTIWIARKSDCVEHLLAAASSFAMHQQKRMTFGDLLMLEPAARPEMLPPLHSQFRRIVGEVRDFHLLPPDQLIEVLLSKNKADFFIGGTVDQTGGSITLARGDLTTMTVPLSVFATKGPCKPDFGKFELDDYGYTLRFGAYEASAHSVLYKVDPEYRRKAHQQRVAEERGFGPSLRRLRILRHLSRDDFPGITSKTIARIERGETERPHGKTLENLAKVLQVASSDIESY